MAQMFRMAIRGAAYAIIYFTLIRAKSVSRSSQQMWMSSPKKDSIRIESEND